MKVKVKSLSRVRLFATPWTVAYQAPPSMGSPGKSAGGVWFPVTTVKYTPCLLETRLGVQMLRSCMWQDEEKKSCESIANSEYV